jgi:hypothetical protein
MDRKIFIIKGYSDTATELDVDRHYVGKYSDYFQSIAGGAYDGNEIISLEEPTVKILNETLAKFDLDFVVIILIGHGATQNDNLLFTLNKNEIIKPGQIKTNADKNLILIESCRIEAQNIYTVDLNDQIPKFKYGGLVRTPISRKKSKEIYDEQLSKCGNGTVVCFACSSNEIARNFYFSLVLLQTSFNWHLEHWHHFETLTISRLMPHVTTEVRNFVQNMFGQNQTPEINGGLEFPFSVSKF